MDMGQSWSIPLFKVFGIRLELHLTFFLLLFYAAWIGMDADGAAGALWSLLLVSLLFVCVVLHELGHCLAARGFGIATRRILLLPIGGMAQLTEMPRQPWREFVITAAGPAVNVAIVLVLGVPLYSAGLIPDTEQGLLRLLSEYSLVNLLVTMVIYNVIMAVFNLVPVFPMDGGRILRSLLAFRLPYLRATQIAVWVARPLAAGAAIYALFIAGNILLTLLFAFIYFAGDMEYRMVKRQEAYQGRAVGDLTARFCRRVPAYLSLGDALQLMGRELPPELVVDDGSGRMAIFSPETLSRLARSEDPSTPLAALHPFSPTTLQASWPVEVFARSIGASGETRFAVYDGDQFIGVLRADLLEEALRWAPRSRRQH